LSGLLHVLVGLAKCIKPSTEYAYLLLLRTTYADLRKLLSHWRAVLQKGRDAFMFNGEVHRRKELFNITTRTLGVSPAELSKLYIHNVP